MMVHWSSFPFKGQRLGLFHRGSLTIIHNSQATLLSLNPPSKQLLSLPINPPTMSRKLTPSLWYVSMLPLSSLLRIMFHDWAELSLLLLLLWWFKLRLFYSLTTQMYTLAWRGDGSISRKLKTYWHTFNILNPPIITSLDGKHRRRLNTKEFIAVHSLIISWII